MATPIDRGEVLYQLEKLALEAQLTDECEEETIRRCIKAIEQLVPTLTPPNEWVSVEERLPEYNPGTGAKSYWIAKKDCYGNWQMKLAQFCDYGYAMTVDAETEVTWRDWDFTKIVNVTHWMPLPKSPKEDE